MIEQIIHNNKLLSVIIRTNYRSDGIEFFTPDDFGVFDIYLKTLGILFVVFALKYDMGVVLPKNRVKALLMLSLSIGLALIFSIIFEVLIYIFEPQILNLLNFPEKYKIALYLLPLSTLFFSMFNTINYLLIRDQKFNSISINKVSRRTSEGVVQIGLAFVPLLKKTGLFIGDLVGNIFYFISAYYQSFKSLKFDKRFFKIKLLKAVAKEYSDLPKYNIIPELLNAAFFASISFLILSKFDIREVGFMELTQRILAIPSAFVAYSVGQVLLQKITELVNAKTSIRKEIQRVFWLLSAMAVPFVLIVILFATEIFTFVFGNQWEISGLYSKYLVVFYALGFVVSPLGQVLISLRKFRDNAIWKIGRFVLVLPLFFVNLKNIDAFLISYAILGSLSYIAYYRLIIYHTNKYERTL